MTATEEQAPSSLGRNLIDPRMSKAVRQEDAVLKQEDFFLSDDVAEEDPALKPMAGTDFKAYVRADHVSTFYGMDARKVIRFYWSSRKFHQ